MGRASIKINLVNSCMRENGEVLDSNKRREERRLKRRLISNENLKHNRCATAKRITVKSCGNMAVLTDNNDHVVEDELDEDYKIFLYKYVYHFDGSDIDIDTGYNSKNDDDLDPQYKMLLENLREQGKSYIFEGLADNQLVHVRYEEEEEERLHDDSVDEDYQIYLNSYMIDCDAQVYERSELKGKRSSVRKNSQVSDQAFDASKVHCHIDERCQEVSDRGNGPCNERPDSDVSCVPRHNGNNEVEFDSVDEDYQIFLNSCRIDGDSLVYEGSELKGKSSTVRKNSQVSDQAFDTPKVQCDIDEHYQQVSERGNGPCNKRPGSDVSGVPKHNCHNEMEVGSVDEDYQIFLNSCRIDGDSLVYEGSELKGKISTVRQNSQVSDWAFNTPRVRCEIDESYQLVLNSARTDDENLVYLNERNASKMCKVDDGSNSSDSELILLEPQQFCENSPFISSKSYDLSWFENERNHRDGRQFSAFDHSQFRKRLMEFLERPYDQEEYDEFLHEVSLQRQKERHRETRQGVVKFCPVEGVNKSYREMYPDLAKAIDQFKEPHKVLFLLRGFIYWLQNLSQDGTFRPWLDASCLEILQKM